MCYIALAGIRDAPTLKKIQELCLPEIYDVGIFEKLIHNTYIYVCNEEIVGYLQLATVKKTKPEETKYSRTVAKEDGTVSEVVDIICSFALLEQYRGKGIGRRLLVEMHKNLRPPVNYLLLQVRKDNPASRLYDRFGFENICELPDYYNNPKCDGVLKVLDIRRKNKEKTLSGCPMGYSGFAKDRFGNPTPPDKLIGSKLANDAKHNLLKSIIKTDSTPKSVV
jgi:ribosomal protein S18 acetylase RimI-like enzyme